MFVSTDASLLSETCFYRIFISSLSVFFICVLFHCNFLILSNCWGVFLFPNASTFIALWESLNIEQTTIHRDELVVRCTAASAGIPVCFNLYVNLCL